MIEHRNGKISLSNKEIENTHVGGDFISFQHAKFGNLTYNIHDLSQKTFDKIPCTSCPHRNTRNHLQSLCDECSHNK